MVRQSRGFTGGLFSFQAKKLKQTWVENVKIKSKWKAQKRKEGTFSSTSLQAADHDGDSRELEEGGTEGSDSDEQVDEVTDEEPLPRKSTLHPSRSHIHPELAPKIAPKPRQTEKAEEAPKPSLRELTREAYSRSSLHTFKADPLNRRRGSAAQQRGGGRGREARHEGRGQPNMKLRMDAMLEKIKRDMA